MIDEVFKFSVDNTSTAYYESTYYKLHKEDLQPVPEPRTRRPRVDLAHVLEPKFLAAITATKKISFHAVGDTGAAKVNSFQTARQALENEANVADAMARDVQAGGATGQPRTHGDRFPWAGNRYLEEFVLCFWGAPRPVVSQSLRHLKWSSMGLAGAFAPSSVSSKLCRFLKL